jgi:5-oxoprolinase (ATP-hydrolysing)
MTDPQARTNLQWQFWIDRGGTFTDIVARQPDGVLTTCKLLSDNPEHYRDAAIAGIRRMMGIDDDAPIPVDKIGAIKMGTTVATNALLERKGEPTVLAITEGFRDQLRIGYQNRPRIFDMAITLPELLYTDVIEIHERIGAFGEIVAALDEIKSRNALNTAYSKGFRAIAIVLMHGYRYVQHEVRLAAIAREIGFTQISVSHEVSPLMKIVSRGDTTVVDAYLSPILRRYVNQVAEELPDTRLFFMQSNGGLTDHTRFQGKDSILSGPAGGIIGMARTAEAAGFAKVIGFDMGGTSTDVSHYAGELEREFETLVAGVRMRAPMLSIHTIAAGGGSILHFDGQRLRVGPDSAGANPGPACYRRGGPLTVTDCNVMLGKIQAKHFPKLFGVHGNEALDADVVRENFFALADEISRATNQPHTPESVAEGFLQIAVANMANAIKFISVARGHDVTEYTLQCFGGAGGQHACLVADELGMSSILIHPFAGVLSAYGMGLADITAMRQASVELPLTFDALAQINSMLDDLSAKAVIEVESQGIDKKQIHIHRRLHLKYVGTDSTLNVFAADMQTMQSSFETQYKQRFSFLMPQRAVIVESVSVEAVGVNADINKTSSPSTNAVFEAFTEHVHTVMMCARRSLQTPILARTHLVIGQQIVGPAIITEKNATTIIEPEWCATVTPSLDLHITRLNPRQTSHAIGTKADPVMLEVFNNLFMSIAEQMGLRLQQTAYSVNIKERLDFSCALFDAQGNLIANAPHMPVHLGSMGDSIKTVVEKNRGQMRPGDAYVLNDPYNGGTHLPDVTVVTPVFAENSGHAEPLFFVGSRGHHADIGGITPGSMPPFSTNITEEGVLLDNVKLVENGVMLEEAIRARLSSASYPARNIDQNIADLRAQLAANEKGAIELRNMVAHFGLDTVNAYMQHVQDNAEECVRRVIGTLRDGKFSYTMDNGAIICVSVTIASDKRSATIDFSGTSAQLDSNFNAPSSVVTAAVLYVFRMLVADDIPLNAGCLKPLTIIIPKGSMLSPTSPAATVAGNVETSQSITDSLIGALGVMAASSGTMNNFTFGNDQYQYYETVSGGTGAGADFHGCNAVQAHMTNSRLTDPEVLEFRFPVRVDEHTIRAGSGGSGKHHGGNGATRKIRFLEPMTAAILAGHHRVAPFGMAGGGAGQVGSAWVERVDGAITKLAYADETKMNAGDTFVLETPGGGGFGQ